MTDKELKQHGYYVHYNHPGNRNIRASVFIHGHRFATMTSRSRPELRKWVREQMLVDFVTRKLG
jgi:hypothetical protein